AMAVVSDLGEIEQTNRTFRDLFGYGPEELKAMRFLDLFEDEDKPYIRSTIQAFDPYDGGPQIKPQQNFEARILTKSGQPRWMEWRQQLCGARLYCAGRDITDIKLQQKALSRREKQLSEAESIGRMGHWHWTIGENVMEWSDEIYRIFGV